MPNHPRVGEILVQAGVIDDFQLRAALGEQTRWGRRLGVTLVKLGFIEERDLVRALASQLGLPVATLEGKRIQQEVLNLVPMEIVEQYMVIPLFVKKEGGADVLYLGVDDPDNLAVFDDLTFRTGMTVKPVMVCASDLCEAIDRYYRRPAMEGGNSAASALPDRPSAGPAEAQSHDGEGSAPVRAVSESSGESADSTLPSSGISSGTAELARHWSVSNDDVMVLDDETLPDAATGSAASVSVEGVAVAAQSDAPDPAVATAQPPDLVGSVVYVASIYTAPSDDNTDALPLEELSSDDLREAIAPDPYAVKTRLILHALTQLIIEKGVMTRDEFHERVRELQQSEVDLE
jgi:type IV pilus assembly protein PilB